MPTWCHMFNSTLTGNARVWFDKLPKESIDCYEDLRTAFKENYLQQTKYIKDPVEIHHIKQRDGESTEDFMKRYKAEVLDVEGAPECMRIFGFMHGITHPGLIKCLYERILKSVDEMYRMTTSFLQGEVAALSHDTGHNTNEYMHLRKQIDEMIKAGKLSQFIKELKQNDKPKAPKKGETFGKDKPLAILMIQPWERVAKPRITQSFSPEMAMSFPPLSKEDGTESQMIIEVEIARHFVHRVYVDGGASSKVLYEHCFIKLRKEIRDQMVPATTHLIGFSGETIWPLGQIALPVKIGDETHSTSAWMNFMVIRSPPQHNAIIGRPGIRKIRVIPSTAHGMLKFPVEGGTTVAIGSTLTEKGRKELCSLLKQNLDIFAWKPADMTGVPRNIAEHRLDIREGYSPIRQKKRGQAPKRNKAIQEEVKKLVGAGIMKEVHYHSWLSNPVMVKKHDETWRMCVDFKDLNNACPKDCYPLPEIDWKVESLCGYPFKCFLDAYKGYHQIKMAKEDEEKTTFITSQGIFCYSKMPFGLKNAGSTYQRLVDKAFQNQIGRNLEVYVDDLVIKSHTEEEIIRDVTETFKTLRQINMKLNPKKCTFGMKEGMFLGYKVSTNGLKACTDKTDAVLSLPSPRCIKDVQNLNGKLAKAFKQMKKLIAELPTLTAPREREELILYLAAAKEANSAVLMTDREDRQIPIYFVSRTLRGSEVNYTPMEKLVLALLSASKRLKRYFQAHMVVVITSQPIKQLLSSSEISGRMLKWKFELEGYDIQYRPRTAIKGQILADFIVERLEEESPDELMAEPEVLPEPFEATNNEAEYEALIAGLWIAEQMGVKNLQANVDSRLVANQVNGFYTAKESSMVQYLNKVKTLAKGFKEFSIKQIRRSENKKADALSKIASTSFAHLNKQVLVEELKEKTINEKEILDMVEEEGNTWMMSICEYLTKEILLKDKKQARAVRQKAVRFGLPGEIISDNGKQFRDNPFKDWCEKLCIRQCFASVKHPQANGLVERANRSLGEGIKARLAERNRDWIEELPHVLWAHRTMIKSSNGETPFSLTYHTEAVIPAEIGISTFRTAELDQANNNEALGINLDLIEEKREQAAIQEAKGKKKMEKYYNSRVRGTSFKPGEMVYRSNEASHAKDGGKLGPKWEGPYEVKESLGKGAYKLKDRKGNDIPRTWNIYHILHLPLEGQELVEVFHNQLKRTHSLSHFPYFTFASFLYGRRLG
ncbi:reverse transcriptase domain-containing protein [Tanacetum coccineum]